MSLAFLAAGLVDIGIVGMVELAPRPLGATPSSAIEGALAPVLHLVASNVRITTVLEASEVMKSAFRAEPVTLEDMQGHGTYCLLLVQASSVKAGSGPVPVTKIAIPVVL